MLSSGYHSLDYLVYMVIHLVFSTIADLFMMHWPFFPFLTLIPDVDSTVDWLEMPGSLILLLVVSPSFFAYTLKDSLVGVMICLIIGCYLLQEHIRASGGFRNSFTQSHGISNTLGIILLLVYPVWALVLHVL